MLQQGVTIYNLPVGTPRMPGGRTADERPDPPRPRLAGTDAASLGALLLRARTRLDRAWRPLIRYTLMTEIGLRRASGGRSHTSLRPRQHQVGRPRGGRFRRAPAGRLRALSLGRRARAAGRADRAASGVSGSRGRRGRRPRSARGHGGRLDRPGPCARRGRRRIAASGARPAARDEPGPERPASTTTGPAPGGDGSRTSRPRSTACSRSPRPPARARRPRALPAPAELADRLLELQLADGGWPWLYDADRGLVVEPYEVFSVHQHGMAPMALLELARSRVTPVRRRRPPRPRLAPRQERPRDRDGRRSASGDDLPLDPAPAAVEPHSRSPLNLACSAAGAPAAARASRRLELNAVCRPYELGWLLEAWAGREALLRESTGARPSRRPRGRPSAGRCCRCRHSGGRPGGRDRSPASRERGGSRIPTG